MCVAFSPGTIYGYAFSHDDGLDDVIRLQRRDIGRFCSVLEQDLTERLSHRIPSRSVCLVMGRDEVETFFVNQRDRFLDFGDEVLFIGTDSQCDAKWIEAKYGDPDVTASLRTARRAIRHPKEEPVG